MVCLREGQSTPRRRIAFFPQFCWPWPLPSKNFGTFSHAARALLAACSSKCVFQAGALLYPRDPPSPRWPHSLGVASSLVCRTARAWPPTARRSSPWRGLCCGLVPHFVALHGFCLTMPLALANRSHLVGFRGFWGSAFPVAEEHTGVRATDFA